MLANESFKILLFSVNYKSDICFLLGKVLKPGMDSRAVFRQGVSCLSQTILVFPWKARASSFPGSLAVVDRRQVGLTSLSERCDASPPDGRRVPFESWVTLKLAGAAGSAQGRRHARSWVGAG